MNSNIREARIAAAQERIDAYHPQPAELAEQQGVGITADWVLGYLNTDAPEDSRDAIRNAFTEWNALAAAGKQQVGESCTHAWRTAGGGSQARRPLVCAKCNQPAELAGQVGEVQGDAAELLAEMRDVEDYFKDVDPNPIHLATVQAAISALAARQPGAHGWSGWATQKPGHMPKLWGTREIAELNHDLTGDARLIFLSEQPAQGIDLGQLRPLIARSLAEWHEDDGNVMWWAWCGRAWAGEPAWCGTPNDSDWPGYHTHWTQHPVQPALIDGQRDAAPGVGNG